LQLALTVTAIVIVSAVIVFALGYVIDKNTEA
jgi:multisubunit Na+/H+ antiporter MnhC subunit